MRRAARRDENEPAIVDALRAVGASVSRLNERGIPDLLVGYRHRNYLLEVKLPLGPKGGKSDRDLTPDQVEWWEGWKGQRALVRTPEEAMAAIGAVKSR